VWTVIDARLASGLEEIDRHWSLCDLEDAKEFLQIKQDYSEWEKREAEKNRANKRRK